MNNIIDVKSWEHRLSYLSSSHSGIEPWDIWTIFAVCSIHEQLEQNRQLL